MFVLISVVAALAASTYAVFHRSPKAPEQKSSKSDLLRRIAKQGISYETLMQDKKRLGML